MSCINFNTNYAKIVAFILKFGIIFALYRGIAKLVRHQVLILTFVGSSPATSAISKLGQSFVIDPIFLFSLTKIFLVNQDIFYQNLNWLC